MNEDDGLRVAMEALWSDWDRIDRLAHAASSDQPYDPITYITELRAVLDRSDR